MKFSAHEVQALKDARKTSPDLSQRGLATKLYSGFLDDPQGKMLANRSEASIYSALRRTDKELDINKSVLPIPVGASTIAKAQAGEGTVPTGDSFPDDDTVDEEFDDSSDDEDGEEDFDEDENDD